MHHHEPSSRTTSSSSDSPPNVWESPMAVLPQRPFCHHRSLESTTTTSATKPTATTSGARRRSVLTRKSPTTIAHSPKATSLGSSLGSSRQNTAAAASHPPARPSSPSLVNTNLMRHGTLLTTNATPARAAAELQSILGNHGARLKSKAALMRVDSRSAAFNRHVTFEQAKSRARLEVDILPQVNVCVQGGHLRGHVKVSVRKASRKETPIFIAGGKIRIVGFEILGDKSRYIFYQCSAMLASVTPSLVGLYASEHDEEGFAQANEGEHEFPFALYLSLSADNGRPRGSFKNYAGFALHYIAMVSFKIKDEPGRRSIAHFYRHIEVWPRLDPNVILAPALRPLQATVSTNSSNDSKRGKIKLTASLHRLHWVAGQRCQVHIMIDNDTDKQLRELTLSLHRTTTIFSHPSSVKVYARCPGVVNKQVAQNHLEVGQPATKGYASARGWWLGVRPRALSEFEHSILIPMDALTVPRGRFFEVEYSLRVTIGSATLLTSDVHVVLPIRVVNFISIDPPPSHPVDVPPSKFLSSQLSYPSRGANGDSTDAQSLNKLAPSRNNTTTSWATSEGEQGRTSDELIASNHQGGKSRGSHGHLPYEKHHQECSSDCMDDGLGNSEPIGNLFLPDDTDDVVESAIAMARMDLTYCGFSDLYYAQSRGTSFADSDSYDGSDEESIDKTETDSTAHALETLIQEVAVENDSNTDLCGPQLKLSHREWDPQRHSSFTARVMEKTRRITTAFLNGDQGRHHHQEQREEPPTSVREDRRMRKHHLGLKVSPVLDGVSHKSSGGPSDSQQLVSRFAGAVSAEVQRDSFESSLQGGNTKLHGKRNGNPASQTTLSLSDVSSRQSREPSVQTSHQERRDVASTKTGTPTCSHRPTTMVYSDSPEVGTSPARIMSSDARDQNTRHENANAGIGLPRVVGPALQVCVDVEKVSQRSDTRTISPTSATSHTSATSTEAISVRDKVRQLEERVKATGLM